MKTRVSVLIFGSLLALSLCACGSSGTSDRSEADPQGEQQEEEQNQEKEQEQKREEFRIGETWTVDGQWALTVTSVEETEDRNEFSEKDPDSVYIVNYTYTNTGYEDASGILDGLYIDMEDTIVDSAGQMGYSYPGNITDYAQETPVGATCNAQACIGVDNSGDFKITVTKYDGQSNKQSATFNLSVSD